MSVGTIDADVLEEPRASRSLSRILNPRPNRPQIPVQPAAGDSGYDDDAPMICMRMPAMIQTTETAVTGMMTDDDSGEDVDD